MHTFRLLLGLATLSLALDLSADTPLPPSIVRPRSAPGLQQETPRPELRKNYKLSLVVTSGDKPVGELTLLTCSPAIHVESPITPESATFVALEGTLTEKEDGVLFLDYTFQNVPNGGGPQAPSRYPVRQQSMGGSLKMKPGDEYEFLKAAGLTYSLRITPVDD